MRKIEVGQTSCLSTQARCLFHPKRGLSYEVHSFICYHCPFDFSYFSLAETKEIISEGSYNMGDGETPTVAVSRALLQAKRTAVEEAGTYVESYSKTKNFQLTADEIQVLASGVMEVEVLEKKRTIVGDGFNFWVKIKARVSTDKMEEMAKRVKEKSVVEDYKRIQEAYDKSQKEIEELKRQLISVKNKKNGEPKKTKNKQVTLIPIKEDSLETEIEIQERLFQANEWFEKGYRFYLIKAYDDAIEAFTMAIILNPNNAFAYGNRGEIYLIKGLNDATYFNNAIADFSRTIDLKPDEMSQAYHNRGSAYYFKGQFSSAISDYTKSISLEPNSDSYRLRGKAHIKMGNYGMATEDFFKACDLGDKETCEFLKKNVRRID